MTQKYKVWMWSPRKVWVWPHPSEEVKQAWLDYRQALRDLPANTTDPENPVWPEAPTP